MSSTKLNASIPANNWKIIELYNKLKKLELDPSPDFQRKLVWKKQHKFKFISTILLNYPFPEIYIAPGKIDIETLDLKDMIVDGQQRCTTIVNYIEGTDVFALYKIPLKKFSELNNLEKEEFLNYEVSIRYLKNATIEQIKEIFQNINSTEYSLNATERINAQWGESEFIFFGKQIIEPNNELNLENATYKIDEDTRSFLQNFFIHKYSVFNENDLKRMLALQYILTLIATLIIDSYFRRNDKVQEYIESFNDEFLNASNYEITLLDTTKFIDSLNLEINSYWFNKANIFTLIIELSKFELSDINPFKLVDELNLMEADYKTYLKNQAMELPFTERFPEQSKYFEYAREAVNEISAREFRGKIVHGFIQNSLK